MKCVAWPSQNPDLNPLEILWRRARNDQFMHTNVSELKQFCKEEWAKMSHCGDQMIKNV